MNISPSEAEEALAAIQTMAQKTRRLISSSGAYQFMILWGVIWLFGFLGSQFLSPKMAGYAWAGLDILGGAISAMIGIRMGRAVRNPSASTTGKRVAIFWLLLFALCYLSIAIAQPVDGRQIAMFIILFCTVGWIAMGLLLSFVSIWPALVMMALAAIGYFLLPSIFYLWMAILGGGGLIGLGLYIRNRW